MNYRLMSSRTSKRVIRTKLRSKSLPLVKLRRKWHVRGPMPPPVGRRVFERSLNSKIVLKTGKGIGLNNSVNYYNGEISRF